jgi:hypothetical protein
VPAAAQQVGQEARCLVHVPGAVGDDADDVALVLLVCEGDARRAARLHCRTGRGGRGTAAPARHGRRRQFPVCRGPGMEELHGAEP